MGNARGPSGLLGHGSSTVGDEAVEQMDPHGKRQLLAGDAVDQRLEDGGKAWRLESTHALSERTEQRVGRGHCGELGEIDGQPEEPVQRAAREYLCMLIDWPAGEADRQAWRVWRAILSHRERDRRRRRWTPRADTWMYPSGRGRCGSGDAVPRP